MSIFSNSCLIEEAVKYLLQTWIKSTEPAA